MSHPFPEESVQKEYEIIDIFKKENDQLRPLQKAEALVETFEEDRIYGKKWIHFLSQSRCSLGTESGASVIDFTGQIESDVREYCRTRVPDEIVLPRKSDS